MTWRSNNTGFALRLAKKLSVRLSTTSRGSASAAANNLPARVKRPCALQTSGRRIAEARGAKRARVAVARKLTILLHKLWQSETEFCWN
ncbi:MAG: hypothetical protein ABI471_09185 [Sphingomonas bacterium]